MVSSQVLVVVVCSLSLISASTLIPDAVFGQQVVSERRLLQVAKPCTVDFENQNYSIITSQCKGPNYPEKPCCNAFKEFACPFADYINDLTTDCAKVMFSYINTNGHYPVGLFASLCREGKEGLSCPAPPPSPSPSALQRRNEHKSGTPPITLLRLLTLLLLSLQFII